VATPNEKPENKATNPAPGERESTPAKPDQDNTYLTWDTPGEGWDQDRAKETTR
jgi:hypothetical protein